MRGKLVPVLALPFFAAPVFADDLWNQQVGVPAAFSSFPQQEFDDGIYDIYTTFMVDDVVVPQGGGWSVNSISIWVTASQPSQFQNLQSARLNVFENPGSTDAPPSSDDPMNGTIKSVTVSAVPGRASTYSVTAASLDVNLGPGEYWIGLTPVGGVVSFGQCYEVFSENNPAGALNGSAARNPGQGYQFSTGADWGSLQDLNTTNGPLYGAIDLEGSGVPEPATFAGLALGLLALRRRSRAR
ncbi:MAG: PEP-CTERM sorting domain-containing protein [Fimbriimonadales bacterium]